MESATVAGQMPDLKSAPCDLSVPAPPANRSMDLERRHVAELPAPLSVLGGALPLYPDSGHQGASVSAYHNGALLANLGLHLHPLKHGPPTLLPPRAPAPLCLNTASGRLYRSMENLHWAAVPDPGLYAFSAPYGSVDSEFIFRCTATSRWYEGGAEGLAFCPPRASTRRDLPLLPQWLFPGGSEAVLNGGARKGLREKLRLQSVRVTEPNKPLRPPAPAHCPSNGRPAGRITSPEEIKQEALRRLQLRRQNSSPDLTLRPSDETRPAKSLTAEALAPPAHRRPPAGRLHIPTFEEFKKMRKKESGQEGGCQNQQSCETKRDQTGGEVGRDNSVVAGGGGNSGVAGGGGNCGVGPAGGNSTVGVGGGSSVVEVDRGNHVVGQGGGNSVVEGVGGNSTVGVGRGNSVVGQSEGSSVVGQSRGNRVVGQRADDTGVAADEEQAGRTESTDSDCGQSFSTAEWSDCNSDSGKEGQCQDGCTDASAVPICTSPTPRPPLQPLASPQEAEEGGIASNTKDDTSALTLPLLRESPHAPPTCCPALLLDGTDLSSYGAKISKMKDGFLGSALDLIKKRVSPCIDSENSANEGAAAPERAALEDP